MRIVLLALVGIVFAVPAQAADPSELAAPVKIRAGGKPIDGELASAAPFVAELDGNRCLLVGQCVDGKLRIYRDSGKGKKAAPRFDTFAWFQDGKAGSQVTAAADSGFTPQVVDLDGDGYPDVLSGSANGELYLFRGKAEGKFAAGEHLRDKDNRLINVGKASTVFAFDWRGTGLLDLIVGTGEGNVYLIPNKGSASRYAFGKPKQFEANGKKIQVSLGYAHPVAADWDQDGKPGLIVGTGAGSVLWFRNIGTRESPKLAAPRTLVAESPLAKNPNARLAEGQWGLQAKVCVVDWNGDGKLDLLMGDVSVEKSQTTAADKIAEHHARHDLEKAQREYNNALQKLQDLEKPVAKETAKTRKEREKKLQSLKDSLARMQKDELLAQQHLARTIHPAHAHGFVWLFLRGSSSSSTASSSPAD
jgi:hypothetical protein